MSNTEKKYVVGEKGSEMQIKRLITKAGRLQDELKPKLNEFKDLTSTIKKFEMEKAEFAGAPVLMVSGEYAALLSAETLERDITPESNRALLGLLGLDKFLELVSPNLGDLKKEITEAKMDELMPRSYSGKGRRFTLSKKS